MVTKERHPRLLRQGQGQDPAKFTNVKEKAKAKALREIGTAEADQNRTKLAIGVWQARILAGVVPTALRAVVSQSSYTFLLNTKDKGRTRKREHSAGLAIRRITREHQYHSSKNPLALR